MIRISRSIAMAAALMLPAAVTSAFAQEAPVKVQQKKLISVTKYVLFGDSVEGVGQNDYENHVARFYADQYRHAQDPKAPYFMFMSRDASVAMGIGGKLEGLAMYDWGTSIDGTDFAPALIPVPRNGADPTRFQTSIAQTSLQLVVLGHSNRLGNYSVKIQGKFSGAKGTFQLKNAYATLEDWTLGYTKSTFCDPAAEPSSVETDGPNSEVSATRFLGRWMHSFKNGIGVALSAEDPDYDYAVTDGINAVSSSYIPDFAGFVQYSWGGGDQHVRLAGIVRPMRYRDLTSGDNRHAVGWGLNLTTVFRPVDPLTIYAAANTGRGISSMVNDLSFLSCDLIARADKPGEMYAPRSYGWYASLQYNFRPNLFSTVIFGQERLLLDKGSAPDASNYKYGLYGVANIFWDITPRCQVGAEFDIGKRMNFDGDNRVAYRIGALASFSF